METDQIKAAVSHTTTKRVWAGSITSLVLLLSLIALVAHHELDKRFESIANKTTALSTTSALFFGRQLDHMTHILSGLNNIRHLGYTRRQDLNDAVRRILLDRKAESPFLLDLLILDPDRKIRHWTGSGTPPQVKDRSYALVHSQNPDSGLFIGSPKRSRAHEGQWFFAVSRAERDSEKKLQAILVAIVDLNALALALARYVGEGSTITITNIKNEVFIHLQNQAHRIGNIDKSTLTAWIEEGVMPDKMPVVISTLDGKKQLTKVQRVQGYNFIAIAGVDYEQTLTENSHYLGLVALFSSLVALTMLLFTHWVAKGMTKQMLLQTQSQQQHALIKSLIDAIPDLIFYKDQNLVYQGCNQAFEAFVGMSENALIGKNDYDLFDQEMADYFRAQDQTMLAEQNTQSIEEPVTYPDGRTLLLETTKSPLWNTHGEISGLIGISHDITERKRVEEAIKNSEERIRLLLASTGEGVFGVNLDGTCIFCNLMAAELLGLESPDDLVGKQPHTLIHHTRADGTPYPQDECKIYRPMKNSAFINVDNELFWRTDGSSFPIEYRSRPMTQNHQIVGVVVTFTDITERIKHEKERRILTQAIENSPSSIVVTNQSAQIEYVNPKFEQMTGYTAKEVIGKNASVVQSGKTEIHTYENLWATILSGVTWHGELLNKKKGGQLHWESVAIAPIKDGDAISHFVAIKTDISAQKNQAVELWQLANFDQLTQLANRNLFHDRFKQALARARRETHDIALLYLDLDRFKPVNDQYGHNAGDKVLQQVANRLRQSIRAEDTAARMGGDEFIILLEGSLQESELSAIADKIIHALGQPIDIGKARVEVGCSIGIARYPKDGTDNDALVASADTALYQAKAKGRGNYVFATAKQDPEPDSIDGADTPLAE